MGLTRFQTKNGTDIVPSGATVYYNSTIVRILQVRSKRVELAVLSM